MGGRAGGRKLTAVLAGAAALVLGATTPANAAPSHSDLEVVRIDADPAPPGGTTSAHGFVANRGPDRTASPFRVTITLPAGFTFESPTFPADCRATAGHHVLTCTFPAGLAPLRTATAIAPVRVDADLPPGTQAEGQVRVYSADDTDGTNNSTPFTLSVS
ncbi:hypothetical protein ACIA8O_14730 [Kitasatospora sp. NPDC051853]|uniref:hypothetical protein n=1 Tax=Kitasatospora sp. NPDC051853 TaxID=3364058 RepID=UPI00379FF088